MKTCKPIQYSVYALEHRTVKYWIEANSPDEAYAIFESGNFDSSGKTIDDELKSYTVYDETNKEWVKGEP